MHRESTLLARALRFAPYVTIIAAFLACLPSLGIPFGLASEGDALDYHIPILKWMLRHHAYPNWSWTYADDYPMLGELLMLPFFAVKQELARLVAILAYFGAAFFAALIGAEFLPADRHGEKRQVRLFLFAGLLGFQPLLVQACQVMVDNLAACFTLGTLYALLRGRVAWAGGVLAAALATRYSAWGAAPAGFCALLVLRRGKPGFAREAFLFTFLASLGALPFLIRNWVLNGNPVYPLLDSYFHGEPFTVMDRWGRGKGLTALLLFPYDLLYTHTFVRELFDTRTMPAGYFSYRLGFLTYLQMLGAAMFARAIPRTNPAVVRASAVFALGLFLFWWFGAQVLRYFGAGLALADAALLFLIAERASREIRLAFALAPILTIALVQGESWRIAFGREPAFRSSAFVASAESCFVRAGVPANAVMGWTSRDALNGYFDYDFVFLPPNELYRSLPGVPPPVADFIYSGIDFRLVPGYQPWPAVKPCLLRRIEPAHQVDHREGAQKNGEAGG